MAIAIVTLIDDEDGETADVKVEFVPPLRGALEEYSTAQLLAMKMVESVATPEQLENALASA